MDRLCSGEHKPETDRFASGKALTRLTYENKHMRHVCTSSAPLNFCMSATLFLILGNLDQQAAQADANQPIDVTSKRHLFLDDHLIASSTNVVRRIHPAEKSKSNPVIRSTEPWEEPLNVIYGSVIRDGQQY